MKIGTRIRVTRGQHKGKLGTVVSLPNIPLGLTCAGVTCHEFNYADFPDEPGSVHIKLDGIDSGGVWGTDVFKYTTRKLEKIRT